ncbi:Eukaryotic translation initiation factor 2 subunit gamma [Astathelohania contejeani]|uniref:protein-synthesizing GTPase n=1 Tax=Astathelohania contejeani TaxID=164912 RepID=A0ABQ7HXX1_9MICR|nr:Eukaryotic translation initiation factor 2 subunit gamma [Thelohania contejeani]
MENETIKNQATINIGTIGHVAHGKSTLVHAISGINTVRFRTELERNITIKLGYANAKIYQCIGGLCKRPGCYTSLGSDGPFEMPCINEGCSGTMRLVRHVSFVDCPGHDVLMATMLNGTAIMDAAILLVAANEPCPQPQTQEHLFAVEIMGLDNLVVVQNKIDLITREQALEQCDQILDLLKHTRASKAPIVPASSQKCINIDAVLDFIVNTIPQPERHFEEPPRMVVIRSFDVNRPGCRLDEVCGGVIGGSLVTGVLKVGDEIEIRPGTVTRNCGKIICKPFVTRITSLKAEKNLLTQAVPGGLIGVGTNMDPVFCRGDRLVGQVMGLKGKLPGIYTVIEVEYKLFKQITVNSRQKEREVEELEMDEQVLLNIGSTTTGGIITDLREEKCVFKLIKPSCCEVGERIAISRKVGGNWRLIGYGKVKGGTTIEPSYD